MAESVRELKARIEELASALAGARMEGWVLRTLCETIPERVFWKDRQSRYLGSNTSFARDCGLESYAEVPGSKDYDHFPKSQAEFFRNCDREVMESGRALLGIEEPQDRADGSTSYLRTNKAAIRNADNSVVGILGTYIDITEEKRTKEQLDSALVRAKVSEAKSDFLTIVSHEIRTPLTLILGPLNSLLSMSSFSEEATAQLQVMSRNARRLKRLIDNVLDLRRMDAGMMTPNPVNADVGALVEQLVRDVQPSARTAQIELGLKLELPLRSRTDATMLERILLNLLANALKFTPPGGSIEVHLYRKRGEICLSVEDSGPGISAADLDHLFDAYEQAGAHKHGGTGLGLALVRQFSELLGGRVEVQTRLGQGTCFSVYVPEAQWLSDEEEATFAENRAAETLADAADRHFEEVAHPGALRPDGSPASGAGAPEPLRVLCVDDNQDMRAHLRSVLAPLGTIEVVENGKVALEALDRFQPDVIVSDVMMPVMDGLELVNELKSRPEYQPIPVILLTARAGQEAVACGLNHGADDYVCKPFEPFELRARARAAARTHRLYRQLAENQKRLSEYKKNLELATQHLIDYEPLAVFGQQVADVVGCLEGAPLDGLPGAAQDALRTVLEGAKRLRPEL